MPRSFFKVALPLAAIGLLAACNVNSSWSSDFDGVPLAELDMSGEAPRGVALYGPDKLIVSEGETLGIDVEGDAETTALLRFRIEDGVLAIGRESGDWKESMRSSRAAIVRLTMPALETMEIAGSGTIEAARAVGDVAIDIAGSGTVEIARIEAQALEVDIAGAGTIRGAGTADSLSLDIAGSGDAELEGLEVGDAEIEIAGSGKAIFMSDGTVDAQIAGSGDVTVIGNARCSVSAAGSGSLNCRPREDAVAAEGETAER